MASPATDRRTESEFLRADLVARVGGVSYPSRQVSRHVASRSGHEREGSGHEVGSLASSGRGRSGRGAVGWVGGPGGHGRDAGVIRWGGSADEVGAARQPIKRLRNSGAIRSRIGTGAGGSARPGRPGRAPRLRRPRGRVSLRAGATRLDAGPSAPRPLPRAGPPRPGAGARPVPIPTPGAVTPRQGDLTP